MPTRSYVVGEKYPIRLVPDDPDATIFWIEPLTSRARAKWDAIQGHCGRQILKSYAEATVDRALASVDARYDENTLFLSHRITMIENGYYGDKKAGLIEGPEETQKYLEGMLSGDWDRLVAAIENDQVLQELRFRGHPLPPAPKAAQQVRA